MCEGSQTGLFMCHVLVFVHEKLGAARALPRGGAFAAHRSGAEPPAAVVDKGLVEVVTSGQPRWLRSALPRRDKGSQQPAANAPRRVIPGVGKRTARADTSRAPRRRVRGQRAVAGKISANRARATGREASGRDRQHHRKDHGGSHSAPSLSG